MSPFEFPGDDAGGGGSGSAAIGWTLVGTALDEGDYALALELSCTVAGTGSVTGSVRYTNADGLQTVDVLTLPLTGTGTASAGLVVHLAAGSDVEYSTTLAGTGGSEVYSALPLLRPAFLPRFSGLAFELYDGADTSRRLRFDVSTVPAATTVIANPPAASGVLALAGQLELAVANVSTTYAVQPSDCVVNCTSGSFTVTLPTAATGSAGARKVYVIANSGAGTITLATTSSQTIDGAAPGTLAAGARIRLVSDGSNWLTI